ncbi:hypothetical protein ACFOGJ_18585 [Marinibaculum pumilum]|uniref:Uncharacterized protein n=1 Tax=Marinibaculum pumilum TaxID=1766165 RepID=A0ABV7L3M2_9PROT
MTADSNSRTDRNQGEGDRESARRYNKDAREFVADHDVSKKAKDAEKALSGKEGSALKEAEKAGKSKAREEDPQVSRDR